MSLSHFPTYTDDRGRMLVAEDADVGFPVRRVFAITGAPAGAVRGEHIVPCRQVMVLISGDASVWTAETESELESAATEYRLEQPGDAVRLVTGVWVRYALSGPETTVMVLADAPFRPRDGMA